ELDETELRLFQQAREQEIPILGICRGQQVINVALGGSLVQHLEDHDVRGFGRSHLAHTIEVIDPSSELGHAAGEHKIRVNSFHHQAIRRLAPGLHETAKGEDGTVVVAVTDMQGRLMGKRVDAEYFVETSYEGESTEGCNYLLTVDMEMDPVPGYQMASWETGYGDFDLVPDFNTLRAIPWLDST